MNASMSRAGMDRLKNDLLNDAAYALRLSTKRIEELGRENRLLEARLRLMECRLASIIAQGKNS